MDIQPLDRRAHPRGASFSRWAAGDGWSIRRMDWLQSDFEGARGSILFANGRGDFVEKYLEALGHWHRRGWNVTSFDWRGQGDSRGSIIGGNLSSLDPLVDDLAAIVGLWIAGTPAPHVLIGHSMGGHLTLRLLAEHLPQVDATVLSAPMLGINTSPLPEWLGPPVASLASRLIREMPTAPRVGRQAFLTSSIDRYEDEAWWYEREPGYRLGPPSWGWINAAFGSMARLDAEQLARVKTPTFLIGTDADRLVSAPAIRRAARLIPDAELHMFRDAAHEILREEDPVRLETFRLIDDFLNRAAPR